MTPLPACLVAGCVPPHPPLAAWRLDQKRHKASWDSGEGARLAGGRWNAAGRRVVYCSLDPATTILEVAVHKTFAALDAVPHVLTSLEITNTAGVFVVRPEMVPNPNWLRPGSPSAGQQAFGDRLLRDHAFVILPSVVSVRSWNLIFDPGVAAGHYVRVSQENFALDTRLHPPR
jgi:RES domain-containing protein